MTSAHLDDLLAQVQPLDVPAMQDARVRQSQLTKPPGSLGALEDASVQLAGIQAVCPPLAMTRPVVAVFAGDHGVHAQQVSPWPQEVTASMIANFRAGGAAVNVLARHAGAEVVVVDMGVAADLVAGADLLDHKVRRGTSDLSTGPAMTRDEALQGILAGASVAQRLVEAGHDCLLTGDMGIANTTASAALVAAFTGASAAEVTGRGTGIDDETLARKRDVVERALALHSPDVADPVGVLAALGGLEHAALAGFVLAAAAHRVPLILDGVIACSAALVARALAPDATAAMIAGHRSVEPGATVALAALHLTPMVDLDLRLGEGSGAALALPLVQGAARVLRDVATFDSAGVTEK